MAYNQGFDPNQAPEGYNAGYPPPAMAPVPAMYPAMAPEQLQEQVLAAYDVDMTVSQCGYPICCPGDQPKIKEPEFPLEIVARLGIKDELAKMFSGIETAFHDTGISHSVSRRFRDSSVILLRRDAHVPLSPPPLLPAVFTDLCRLLLLQCPEKKAGRDHGRFQLFW